MLSESDYQNYLDKIKNTNYSSQDHWDVFGDLYYHKVSDYRSMDSFRTNGISNMLETALPSQERDLALSGKNYDVNYNDLEIKELVSRFNELVIMMKDDLEVVPFNTNIGNPRRYAHEFQDKTYLLNFDDLYHVYSAWQIKRMIDFLFHKKQLKNVLEIGAGYGNLASKIKKMYKNAKYIIVDLPEVLLTQHYYLSNVVPDCKIVSLLGTENINCHVDDVECDVLLIPYGAYESVQMECELVINTRSFGEMPRKTLESYFSWFQTNIKDGGILYTTNRYVFTKSKDKNKIRDYPFDNRWNVIVSQPQWLQTHLHEFLLQRTSEESPIPLKLLLSSFPISTPPPGPIMQDIQTQSEWLKHQKEKA